MGHKNSQQLQIRLDVEHYPHQKAFKKSQEALRPHSTVHEDWYQSRPELFPNTQASKNAHQVQDRHWNSSQGQSTLPQSLPKQMCVRIYAKQQQCRANQRCWQATHSQEEKTYSPLYMIKMRTTILSSTQEPQMMAVHHLCPQDACLLFPNLHCANHEKALWRWHDDELLCCFCCKK